MIICFRSRPGYEIEWSFLCRVVDQVKKGDCCERSRYGDTVYAVGPVRKLFKERQQGTSGGSWVIEQ